MSLFSAQFWQSLLSSSLLSLSSSSLSRSKRQTRRGAQRPRRNCVGQYTGGERLEGRSLFSANPIVTNPVAISGFENQPLSNVPVATFTAGDGSTPAANFNAAIAWGDGVTTAGNVTEVNGVYFVTGSHTYSDIYTNSVIVAVADKANPTAYAFAIDPANIAPLLPDGTQGTADQRYVNEVLKTTLQRPVTMEDVNYWTGQFVKNDHDRQTFVFILLENTPPYEYFRGRIASAYHTYLHRDPDPAGEAYYLQMMLTSGGVHVGSGVNFGTQSDLGAILMSSSEFYYDAGGTTNGFITAAFEDALKRPPSAADLAFYGNQLMTGTTHIEFATELTDSYEFQVLSVNGLYERYLGRAADAYGLQMFVNNINAGYGTTSNTETILDSDEFYNRAVGLPLNTVS
ncbi:MAG TPA: DUF4214 domain-containing protein [Pirellulales bacterium]